MSLFSRLNEWAMRQIASDNPTNLSCFERAQKVIPGGVNSPVRAFRSVGGTPYFVSKAKGPYVYDMKYTRYIDYVQSYGANILGHRHGQFASSSRVSYFDGVIGAIAEAVQNGVSYGAPTLAEVELAELMCERVDAMEMTRFVSSGTEATMTAVRLARGVTGRDVVVKFAGCYHGHSDALLVASGSGVAQQGLASSKGVTAGAVADTVVVPFNVVPDIDERVAVVCVEPVAANMGLVPPSPGFLEGLRAACDAAGALLMFDEVITGFRIDYGGAASMYGVQPDIWCFGKVIGGGLPMGAFGASTEIMSHLAPLGDVYQAGTLSGNPLATAAGLETLKHLTHDAYRELERIAIRLQVGLQQAFMDAGVPAVVPRAGSLLGLFFTDVNPVDFSTASTAANNGMYPKFFHGMLKRGVALAPSPYEAIFVSLAHKNSVIDKTIEAAHATASELAAGVFG